MSEATLAGRERVLELLESYESLLTDRQRESIVSYFRYDLSLGEIAEQEGISRAGVCDALKKAVEKLEEFEFKLGLVKKKKQWAEKEAAAQSSGDPEQAYRALVEEIIHGI